MTKTEFLRNYSQSALAAIWRRIMFRTRVVAITGSYGKTSAHRFLRQILSSKYTINWMDGANYRQGYYQTLLRTRFSHRVTVMEVGTKRPGALWRASWLVAPDVVLVLHVDRVHTKYFPDLDAIAAEKAQLLHRLGKKGIAVLNADDPRVLKMRDGCRGRVFTFSREAGSDLWSSEVRSPWPKPLTFRAHTKNGSCLVRTQLYGEHWLYPAMGALLTAVALGVPLEEAAAEMGRVPPCNARMQPVKLANGAVLLRDDYNPSLSTLGPALEVLGSAKGVRRVAILSDGQDSPLDERERLEELGRRVAGSADVAIFIGENTHHAARTAEEAGLAPGSAVAAETLAEAIAWVRDHLRSDDLILLRSGTDHHNERLFFLLFGTIGCWKERCTRLYSCDRCPDLGFQSGGTSELPQAGPIRTAP